MLFEKNILKMNKIVSFLLHVLMGHSKNFPYTPYGGLCKNLKSSDFLFEFNPSDSPMEEQI